MIEDAVRQMTSLNSKAAKEKYLKDNFDQSFIEKIKTKVPAILEDDKFRRRQARKSLKLDDEGEQETAK